MAQTNKINVYRIKDPSIPDSELVKNYQDYRLLSHPEESNDWSLEQLQIESVAYYIPIDNIGSVYVKQSREAKTRWCSSFFLDTTQLYSRSMGGILNCQNHRRWCTWNICHNFRACRKIHYRSRNVRWQVWHQNSIKRYRLKSIEANRKKWIYWKQSHHTAADIEWSKYVWVWGKPFWRLS